MSALAETLRPHVDLIRMAADGGDERAREIIALYEKHRHDPRDRAAARLCEEAYRDWIADLRRKP